MQTVGAGLSREGKLASLFVENIKVRLFVALAQNMQYKTRLLQRLGERYASVFADCRHVLRMVFAQYNGHEVDAQGDAFFVAFARPPDAVLAAATIQRGLAGQHWSQDIIVRRCIMRPVS